jgi:hypothetical protein
MGVRGYTKWVTEVDGISFGKYLRLHSLTFNGFLRIESLALNGHIMCLAGKKNLMSARVPMLLKSRASLICFRTCFLPGRSKDLAAPRKVLLRPRTWFPGANGYLFFWLSIPAMWQIPTSRKQCTTFFTNSNRPSLYYQSYIYVTTDSPVSCLKNNIKIYFKTAPVVFIHQLMHQCVVLKTILKCTLKQLQFYLFTNWCTSELS